MKKIDVRKFFETYHTSSHQNSVKPVFCKKDVLRNFAKFTGKHLCQSLFCNKVAGLRSATLLKKRLWHRCFPVSFSKFLRTPFLKVHLWWLLLLSGKISPQPYHKLKLLYILFRYFNYLLYD